ncbi:MAG: phosphodiester glycosidase family protein [Chloroflexi bacterium]|nr:phosphodiester glycosidase family protein [Chloroflexota bacterium]
MNKAKILMAIFLALLLLPLPVWAGPVTYQTRNIRGVEVNLVWVNLNSPRVHVESAIATHWKGKSFPAEKFSTFIKRLTPAAAINGTYYDVRTFMPIGTIVSNGRLVHVGTRGSAFCFTYDNRVDVIRFGLPGIHHSNLKQYENVITSGPTLVLDGKVVLDPRSELFRDPGIYRPAKRSTIGITYNNKLILATVKRPVYLHKMANIMKDLGCKHAISLDGGSSSALYVKGKYVTRPARLLTNCIVVYEKPVDMFRITEITGDLSRL